MQCSSPPVIALVPAAGQGTRVGAGSSKILLKLHSETILERTVKTILSSRYISRVVIMVRESDVELVRALNFGANEPTRCVDIIVGGQTRQESVCRGLQFLEEQGFSRDNPYVLVHDAARCFVSVSLVERCITDAFEYKTVTAALPLADTITKVNAHMVVEGALDREGVWVVQTPQVFSFDLISAAHKAAECSSTDDASLVQKLRPVHVVRGDPMNFKITTPEDLELARRILGN